MRRLAVIGTVTAGFLLLAGTGVGVSQAWSAMTLGATAAVPRVGVSTVQYDSPGATVPAIVTLYNAPAGYSVAISATGTGGSAATCAGPVWRNPIQHTVSRACYLRLPVQAGQYSVRGTVSLSKAGVTRTFSTLGSRPVVADGKVSPSPMSPAEVEQIARCHHSTDDVWLTFDDGGSTKQVTSILATLKRNNVKAHFFFRGDWARKNPALFQKIRTSGHVIGNHTSTHPALSRMNPTNVGAQIEQGTTATGSPRLLRPPFGAGAFSTRLEQIAQSKGYELCRWTTDTYDWQGPSVKAMVERITYGDYLSAPVRAGGVILMHGHGRNTAPGLQQIINAVHAKRLTLQRLR